MTVIEIGDIGTNRNSLLPPGMKLPTKGIVIEATEKELRAITENLLYHGVKVTRED